MQDPNGDGTFSGNGPVHMPCPRKVIARMVRDALLVPRQRMKLAQCIDKSDADDTAAFHRAARIYNSGSINASGGLAQGMATHCYPFDVANRLTGWVHAHYKSTLGG